MISTEKTMLALWCPHVRAIHIDALSTTTGLPPGAGSPSLIGANKSGPQLIAVAGNRSNAPSAGNILRSCSCVGRYCANFAWQESAWQYSQRTGKQFDPAFDGKKHEPSDRLGACGLGSPGQPHSREDERAMIQNLNQRGEYGVADDQILKVDNAPE